MSILGRTVTDTITGFTGVAIGHVQYLTGCNQALVQPRASDTSKKPDSEWIDEQRLLVDDNVPAITLDNTAGAGCDIAAPKR